MIYWSSTWSQSRHICNSITSLIIIERLHFSQTGCFSYMVHLYCDWATIYRKVATWFDELPSHINYHHFIPTICVQRSNNTLLVSCVVYILLTLKALPHQWVALDSAILQSLRSKKLTSVSPFFFVSLLMVERGSSVGRMPDSQSREPGFESPLIPFRSLGIFFHFTMPQSTQLYKWVPGYRQWWKCEWIVVAQLLHG